MGRPPKEGVDFSDWDVTVLEDPKIMKLIDAQGIAAFTVYFYLCLRAFNENGYFLCWGYDQCATDARELGKGASAQYIRSCVEKCLQIELFDKELFERHGILTSRGIQRRFWGVKKKRVRREAPTEYWLLGTPQKSEEGAEGIVSCTQKPILTPENPVSTNRNPVSPPPKPHFTPSKPHFTPSNPGFVTSKLTEREKEKEEEKRRKKEEVIEKDIYSLSLALPRGKHQNVMLTDEQYTDIKERIPDADTYIDRFSEKLHTKGYTFADHHATILAWWESDRERVAAAAARKRSGKPKAQGPSSFETDEFMRRALARSCPFTKDEKENANGKE